MAPKGGNKDSGEAGIHRIKYIKERNVSTERVLSFFEYISTSTHSAFSYLGTKSRAIGALRPKIEFCPHNASE